MKLLIGLIFSLVFSHALAVSVNYPTKVRGLHKKTIKNNSFFYSKQSNFKRTNKDRYARFDLNITESGFYDIYADIIAKSGKENSFYVQINNEQPYAWHTPYSSVEKRAKVVDNFFLKKGHNYIYFFARESNTMIADVEARFDYYNEAPKIYGPKKYSIGYPTSKTGVKRQVIKGNSFFYGQNSNFNSKNLKDYVSFKLTTSSPGFYHMKANVVAPNDNDNSFYVKVNDRFPQVWHVNKTTIPRFTTVNNDIYLPKGDNEIFFYIRENHTKIADLSLSYVRSPKATYVERFSASTIESKANRLLEHLGSTKELRTYYEPYEQGSRRVLWNKSIQKSDEYTLSYRVKFGKHFEFVHGGKLHGMGPLNKSTGCTPEKEEGWSNRAMFDSQGRIFLYIYEQDRPKRCGRGVSNNHDFKLQKNKWYTVSIYTKLNSRGDLNDGVAKLYIDGKQIIQADNIRFRGNTKQSTQIQQFLFSTFHGGSTTYWSPSKTVHADFDDFVMVKGDYPRR